MSADFVQREIDVKFLFTGFNFINGNWAASRENVPSDMCTQRKLKSACASAESVQSSLSI